MCVHIYKYGYRDTIFSSLLYHFYLPVTVTPLYMNITREGWTENQRKKKNIHVRIYMYGKNLDRRPLRAG